MTYKIKKTESPTRRCKVAHFNNLKLYQSYIRENQANKTKNKSGHETRSNAEMEEGERGTKKRGKKEKDKIFLPQSEIVLVTTGIIKLIVQGETSQLQK